MALVFPHEYKTPLNKVVIRVDNNWYDCTAWRHSHPGGAELIDKFHNCDASDAFYSLHSKDAIAKLHKMTARPANDIDTPRDTVSHSYEKLRNRLEAEGWFKRNWAIDFFKIILPILLMCTVGTLMSYSHPILATILIGIGMQQAGWTGHDYTHGRGFVSCILGDAFGGMINGFSSRWWSHKHNTHHTFPNRKEYDSDIHNEPILHLWFPPADSDMWYRHYQYLYYPFAYTFLYVSWRLQSLQYVLGSRNWAERALIAVNYMWLACLPWYVSIGSILLGGWLVAMIVTANHQTEEILDPDSKYNFVVDQFRTTRGVECLDPVSEYIFGGMQYQLEHHLYPTMPRYRYPALRKIIKQFAAENELQYHMSGVAEIFSLNYQVMRKYSQ